MRRHLTYANVMATLAFAIAVAGGTAYAANTVFSSDIVNGEVKSVDIGTGQVRTADIGNDQIRSADVRDVSLPGGGLNGGDIQYDSLTGLKIINGSISSPDIEDGSIGPDQVGELNDDDIAQVAVVNFPASVGGLGPGTCSTSDITGLNAQGDHLVLTPSRADMSIDLIYDAAYEPSTSDVSLQVCNPTPNTINDGTTHFNLLVIDAQ